MKKEYIYVESEERIVKLDLSEIIYIEKEGRKAIAVTEKETYEWCRTKEQLKDDVDSRFMFCHRSYIVNMDRIMRMEKQKICLDGGHELYFGRETFRRAMHIFRDYISTQKNEKNSD